MAIKVPAETKQRFFAFSVSQCHKNVKYMFPKKLRFLDKFIIKNEQSELLIKVRLVTKSYSDISCNCFLWPGSAQFM